MSKVALITIFSINNYGSVLQAYASQRMFELAGVECEIINYRYPNAWHYANGFGKIPLAKRVAIAVAKPLLKAFDIPSHHVSFDRLREFCRSHLRLTRVFGSLQEMDRADWSGYDAVVAGSDQIWNPRFLNGDKAFMLSFVPEGVRRLSLASSFACGSLPEGFIPHYRKWLGRFDAITVREPAGVDIVRNQLRLDIDTASVPDPTLLLSADEWRRVAAPAMKSLPDEPYIVLYPLHYAFECRPYIYNVARRMQQLTGCLVVALGSDPEWPSDLRVENRRNASVEEFVALMSNARCVVTSSFHGTAFAVNFGRPLISIVPSGASGDDRQSSLLRALGIGANAVETGAPLDSLHPEYDTALVSAALDRLRRQGIDLILKHIPS